MKTKTMKATFIGKDGSLGFTNGKQYDIEILPINNGSISIKTLESFVNDKQEFESLKCDYESIIAFFNNWTSIITKT